MAVCHPAVGEFDAQPGKQLADRDRAGAHRARTGGVGRADGELGIGALRRYLFENGCRRAVFAHGQVFRSLMASPRSRQELIAAPEPIAAVVCNYAVNESALLCATTAPAAPVRIMEGSDR